MIKELDKRKRIAIITSGHLPYDERIFWKFGKTLSEKFDVCIISSKENINTVNDNIQIIGFIDLNKPKAKIEQFLIHLSDFNPELVFCAQPLTILAAIQFKKKNKKVKIVYDVTEWYPENITTKLIGLRRIFNYIILFLLNILTSNLCDWIVVGESVKKRRYKIIAPLKHSTIIGYYPVLKFFNYTPPLIANDKIVLCYAGVITIERGIIQLFEVAKALAVKRPGLFVSIIIAGKFTYEEEEIKFKRLIAHQDNVNITFKHWTDYDKVYFLIKDADICFDLRKLNFIYKNSLPIKLFEYMACGKPFIYSDISAIRNEIGDISCGFLVNPDNVDEIVDRITDYIDNKSMLKSHSLEGRKIIENGKNWETESNKLLSLVDTLLK